METVGTDSRHHERHAGVAHELHADRDLGIQAWRRHISPGLIPHTQSSRIWRQATQVGQTPLVSHITDRFGTGNYEFRTWDSLPFVMTRRRPMIQTRAISGSNLLEDQQSTQQDASVRTYDDRAESQVDSTAVSAEPKEPAPHTNASLIVLKRQAEAVSPDSLPLLQTSGGAARDWSRIDLSEDASLSGSTRDQTLHLRQGNMREESASVPQQQISPFPVLSKRRAGDLEYTTQGLDNGADVTPDSSLDDTAQTVTPAFRHVPLGTVSSFPLLRSINQSTPTSGSASDTTMAEAGSIIGSHKDWQERGIDGRPMALQPPIVRRVLRRDVLPASQRSGDSDQPADRGDEHDSVHGRSTSIRGMVPYADESGIVRAQQSKSLAKPLETPENVSFDRPHLRSSLSIVLPKIQRQSDRRTHGEAQAEQTSSDALVWRFASASRDPRQTGEASSAQQVPTGSPDKNGSPTQSVLAGSTSVLPLVQATDRSPSNSKLPTILWRSVLPGITNDARSLDGLTGHQAFSGSISHAAALHITREGTHSSGSYVPHPDLSSMHERPASSESREPSPSVDVAELAEQVSRFLTKQLVVERERRGVSL